MIGRTLQPLLAAALVAASPAAGAAPPAAIPPLRLEAFTLPNGLSVILHPDRTVPRVVVDTWFGVGSKDEAAGRTGFAHLFEHLMFMGTRRVPGSQFDQIMEAGGGANNASTSEDRTNYFSWGPPALLSTLLWLDADRLQALGRNMTGEKLDLQRSVVRNERRQSHENQPYGAVELLIPELMYPPGHPYHHPVIGSHEDLEAASVAEVVAFFDAFYVPPNASLVVAGDFDPAVVRPMVERLFGAIPPRPVTRPPPPPPARLDGEVRRVLVDRVELPRLDLVWHAPPAWRPGSAELELLARVLGDGTASRLVRRLVLELRLAESVEVALEPRLHGSLFRVQVTGVPAADLEAVKLATLGVLDELSRRGPTAQELARAKARQEAELRAARENLLERADRLNEYRFLTGQPDGFARDLARHAAVTAAGVRDAAGALGPGRLDLRVLPRDAASGAIPDTRPADLAAPPFAPPEIGVFRLASGLEVRALPIPGSGLFAAHLIVPGASRALPAGKAGAAALLAALLTSGAGGRSATEFGAAAAALGAEVEADAPRGALLLSARGLSRNLAPTLDLLADAALRPTLAPADFEREKQLLAARVEARASDARLTGAVVLDAELFGAGDPRGQPADGFPATVASLSLEDVRALRARALQPRAATLVVAGDVGLPALRGLLERRLGAWRATAPPPPAPPPPLTELRDRRLALVDRPGAPQTLILAARPMAPLEAGERAARRLVGVALGGGFTSRLNQNLRERHGYTYGARAGVEEREGQPVLLLATSVQTEVTGAALGEIRKELEALGAGGVEAAEATKARETVRGDLAEALGTSAGLARLLAQGVLAGLPADLLRGEVAALDGASTQLVDAAARGGAFRFRQLTLVLVGDAEKLRPQLQAAGLGEPVMVDAEGRPAR